MKAETVQKLDPRKVLVSTLNTRQPTREQVAASGLPESIKAIGQTSPAIVRVHPKKKDHYELAAGARRRMACEIAGVPLDAIIREIPDKDFEDMILVDNLQHEDPDPWQEALLIERRMKAGMEPSEIAARYGKDNTWLKRRMKLLNLTPKTIAAWKPGGAMEHFTTEMMEYLGTMEPAEQDELASDSYDCAEMTSLRGMLEQIRYHSQKLEGIEWLHDPVSFIKGCGPGCATNTAEGLFPDPEHPCGLCVNADCFRARQKLVRAARLSDLLAGKDIAEFVLISPKHYRSTVSYQNKDHKIIYGYEFNKAYTVVKKQTPETKAAIDFTDEDAPAICFVKRKTDAKGNPAGSDGTATKKDPREKAVHAKRRAAINTLIVAKLEKAPRPEKPSILTLVGAFGTNSSRSGTWRQKDWEIVDDGKSGRSFVDHNEKKMPVEDALWESVTRVLRSRLQFFKNGDLMEDGREKEMRRTASLIGLDYDKEYARICTEEVKVPKSWGPGIDPITLKPIGKTPPPATAEKPAAKKAPAKKAAKKTAKKTAAKPAKA